MNAFFAAASVLASAGCNNYEVPSYVSEQVASADGFEETNLPRATCRMIKAAKPSANDSLRGAFASNKEGMDYGGGVIDALVEQKGYRFIGAELVSGTCYAYAQATGENWGKSFNLRWRCPVKAYSDDQTTSGLATLEFVEDRMCDFDVSPGDPARQDVDVDVLKM